MPGRTVQFEGKSYQFPDDATDDEISQVLAASHDQSQSPPNVGLAPASGDPRRNPVLYRDQLRHEFTPHNPDDILGRGDTAENLAGYVDTGPVEMGRGAINIGRGNIARGGHQVISGGMTTAAPAMLPLAPTAPLHAAAAMGIGYVGGKLTKAMAEESGLNPEQSEFAGDIGNVVGGYGGAKLTSPTIRGTGSLIKKVAGAPDLPTNIPSAPMTNFLLKAINSSRSGIGQVGRKMANYGIPQAPNVAPGPGEPPPEADLPAIRPDESSHYNDVQDQGESNRLMDAVRGHDFIKPSDRSPVSPSSNSQYDDVSVEAGIGPEMTTTKMVDPIRRPPQLPSRMFHGTNADFVHNILSEGIQPQDVGANEVAGPYITGRADIARNFMPPSASPVQRHATLSLDIPNKELGSQDLDTLGIFGDETARDMGGRIIPSSRISGVSYDPPIELPESSLTKSRPSSSTPLADSTPTPNSNTLLRAIKSAPGWPENGLPNKPWSDIHAEDELPDALSTDPYNRPVDRQIQDPSYLGPERRQGNRLFDDQEGGPDSSFDQRRPGLAETTAASDPTSDAQALDQARQELPDGTLSDHLQRAAQIAAQRRSQK